MQQSSPHHPALVVSVGKRIAAFHLSSVIETLRPLPIEVLPGTPRFVLGLSVIRGAPMPVIDLHTIVGEAADPQQTRRFVTLRLGERTVAVRVDSVLGIKELETKQLEALPPLVAVVETDIVEAVGARDAQLLMVLRASRLIPDDLWAALDTARAST